jgi:hypothetical protein
MVILIFCGDELLWSFMGHDDDDDDDDDGDD